MVPNDADSASILAPTPQGKTSLLYRHEMERRAAFPRRAPLDQNLLCEELGGRSEITSLTRQVVVSRSVRRLA